MSSEKNLVLQASDISIVFGGLCAVSDASFDLYEGELIGLIGPNGAGKTTMFNMVSGIYTPTSGQLSYWDRENKVRVINKANPAQLNKLGIARTFQNIRLFGNLTVLDNVRIALHNSRISNPLDVLFRTSRFRRDEQIMTEKVMQLLSLFWLTTLQKLRVVIPKPDYWSQKAFREGYPARSVYKLQEIDQKFGMLKKSSVVLDLGAAPGSWTTWLLRNISSSGKVVSCDLNPLAKDVRADNLVFFQGDLLSEEIREQIKAQGPYDLVVCDAAPLTTGNRTVDTLRSKALVEMAIWYAQTMLKPGANFCVKIFQNGDQQKLLMKMREVFTQAKGVDDPPKIAGRYTNYCKFSTQNIQGIQVPGENCK